ncbi:GSU2403 family nucleotidyltransferase fold protein [Phyllobacterium sophorae]|uniref:Nucleotidyltransferase-like domain-containing protein n=1 Tax=Phyllobacterium sophorae TaxID=1520277 RepID=A0A2P7BFD2_9HYPH|nr:GSU2403 family nucleotidyltransferase fold protein [Phyllobacterium sophorae]PSH65163.1 hypothetical protein CU103_09070 [Phyllobacterium sophorae]
MNSIDFVFRIMLAELGQRIAELPDCKFDTEGRFVPVTVKGRRYWYFDMRGARGGSVRKYVGPDSDETVRQLVTQFRELKTDASARRKIVRMLTRDAKLPAPNPLAGKIIRGLAEAGIFRRGCVLIEQNAYECFAAFLGVELPKVPWENNRAGISMISHAAGDAVTVEEVLKTFDRSFAREDRAGKRQGNVLFVNNSGFSIELAAATLMTAYLVEDPAAAVMLYKSGIVVTVPRPERYAVHELMMSARAGGNQGSSEREYFRTRALVIMQAMLSVRRQMDLAEAYEAAWNRNDTWRGFIERGIKLIDDMHLRTSILEGLTQGMKDIGHDPAQSRPLD